MPGQYDESSNFEDLLRRSGLNRSELAERLQVDRATVSRWGKERPVPGAALAYLSLYVSVREAL